MKDYNLDDLVQEEDGKSAIKEALKKRRIKQAEKLGLELEPDIELAEDKIKDMLRLNR